MASLVCKVIGMWLSYLGLDVDETWCCRGEVRMMGRCRRRLKGKQLVFVGWDFRIRSSFCCLQASSCEFECEGWSHCVPCRYAVFSIKKLHITGMILSYHMALQNQLQVIWELICRMHAHKPSHALSYRSNPTAQSYILNSKPDFRDVAFFFGFPFQRWNLTEMWQMFFVERTSPCFISSSWSPPEPEALECQAAMVDAYVVSVSHWPSIKGLMRLLAPGE